MSKEDLNIYSVRNSYDPESLVLMPVYFISVRWPRGAGFKVGNSHDRHRVTVWSVLYVFIAIKGVDLCQERFSNAFLGSTYWQSLVHLNCACVYYNTLLLYKFEKIKTAGSIREMSSEMDDNHGNFDLFRLDSSVRRKTRKCSEVT